jgi:dTDP-4-dehydrorhamnose 3,5-epimerase-like enzyme
MMTSKVVTRQPYLLSLQNVGDPSIGFIAVAESYRLPFDIKRVYWIYQSPSDLMRGQHAHHKLEQIFIPLNGTIDVELESQAGERHNFILNKADVGLYVPTMFWGRIKLSENAVLLCLASRPFEESDYISDYEQFKRR